MKVIEKWDRKGNPIFEVGSKRIFFDLDLPKRLAGRNISIRDMDSRLLVGQAWPNGIIDLNFSEIICSKKNNSFIKREIIETLAHESRHISQKEPGFIDKLVPYLSPSLVVALVKIFFLGTIAKLFCDFLWPDQWFSSALMFLGYSALSLSVAMCLLYYFSPSERDARSFAEKALKDEDWLEAVKVEDRDTP